MTLDDPVWDDEFHGYAWQAFAEGVARTQGISESGAAKRRAYELYEQRLDPPSTGPSSAPPP